VAVGLFSDGIGNCLGVSFPMDRYVLADAKNK
jgi:hypothetical protein